MRGAEPFFFRGSDVGCLVCHGFIETPQSMCFLGEFLAAKGRLTVAGPRLAGHGTSEEALARTTAEDWIRSAEASLQELRMHCSTIFVTGLSMGGTLGLYLAAMFPELVQGVVPINAPVFFDNPELAGLAFMAEAPGLVPGIASDIKLPGVARVAYANVPVPAIRQLYALVGVTRELLPRVRCPALVMQSREDHVVVPDNAPFILERIGSGDKHLLWLENSYHVATLDHDKERIARETLNFIRANRGRERRQTRA